MRSSLLCRSVVAVASLAVGSAVLAVVPAGAAAPAGLTRAMVLTAADSARRAVAQGTPPDQAGTDAASLIAFFGCNLDVNETVLFAAAKPVVTPGSADGVVVSAVLVNSATSSGRYCYVSAVVTRTAGSRLSGTSTMRIDPSTANTPDRVVQTALSGDVSVSAPVYVPQPANTPTTLTAQGSALRPYTAVETIKVADKKTRSQKKRAKKTYEKRLKAAKKTYRKALKKAGRSATKKAAAQKSYSATKKAAKARYRYAIAPYILYRHRVTRTETKPFSIATGSSPAI